MSIFVCFGVDVVMLFLASSMTPGKRGTGWKGGEVKGEQRTEDGGDSFLHRGLTSNITREYYYFLSPETDIPPKGTGRKLCDSQQRSQAWVI